MKNEILRFYYDAHTQKYTVCLLWVFDNSLAFNKTF